jgi:integrase
MAPKPRPEAGIVPVGSIPVDLSTDLATETESALKYVADSVGDSTKLAYAHAWKMFLWWCESKKVQPLPADPENVARYLSALADGTVPDRNGKPMKRKYATIAKAFAAIGHVHEMSGFQMPTKVPFLKREMKGIARRVGRWQTRKKALTSDLVLLVLPHVPKETAVRDTAILLLGWAMAARRSEIVALNIEDIEIKQKGLVALLRQSKTDQEGRGTYIDVSKARDPRLCPVSAVQALMKERGEKTGPLFVSEGSRQPDKRIGTEAVADLVKRVTKAAGLDWREFSGHSLRAGFVTSAARAGKGLHEIQKKTRHKSLTTLGIYIRGEGDFENDVGKDLL